jgi:hypothetical protein
MSKKQKTTSKKALPKKAKRAGSARRARPTLASATSTTAGTTDDADDGSASRLPAVGTVIIKRDRHGVARCQCTVVEGGIRYKSRMFRSLSGAAMAAASDLGLKNKTQNGFTFWGLSKPTRKLADPVAALNTYGKRFINVASAVTLGATDHNRAKIRAGLQGHREQIENLLAQVAS